MHGKKSGVEAKPFAEIIESSLASWTAQTWQWDVTVPFGSLVTIEEPERTLFGIVHQAQTGSMDPSRYPFTYQKTHEQLRNEQPQIFEFLKTTISCISAGYYEDKSFLYLLPPQPPRIHAFVRPSTAHEYESFFQNDLFLHLLFSLASMVFNIDELLLCIIKNLTARSIISSVQLTQTMRTYSLLTGGDYRRLKLFLQRSENLITP